MMCMLPITICRASLKQSMRKWTVSSTSSYPATGRYRTRDGMVSLISCSQYRYRASSAKSKTDHEPSSDSSRNRLLPKRHQERSSIWSQCKTRPRWRMLRSPRWRGARRTQSFHVPLSRGLAPRKSSRAITARRIDLITRRWQQSCRSHKATISLRWWEAWTKYRQLSRSRVWNCSARTNRRAEE